MKLSIQDHEKKLKRMVEHFEKERKKVLEKIKELDKFKVELDEYNAQIKKSHELGRNFLIKDNFKIGK